ncbi:MAG TPA: RNA-binding S4 domain-containing protein [Erysipelothrix sp.]|jgi:ribosomal 50S subunit-recycling heat shock protein|nr:RNA-binding S4 domain-containing protein [Erysipelothrix sp.]
MRIDKYLKVARVLKRRTVAKELGDQGRLSINGKTAKASSEVSIGDIIDIYFGNRHLKIRVLDIKAMSRKNEDPIFEIIEQEKVEPNEITQ